MSLVHNLYILLRKINSLLRQLMFKRCENISVKCCPTFDIGYCLYMVFE